MEMFNSHPRSGQRQKTELTGESYSFKCNLCAIFSATQIQLRHHPTNRNLLTFRMRVGAAEVASAHQRALIYYYVMLVNT